MLSCFGIRARPAQPALAKDQSDVTASVGVNNVPAAGEGGADPPNGYEECHQRVCRLRGSPRLGPVTEESEGSGAVVRPASRGAYGAAGKPREHAAIMQDTVSMRPSFCTWVDGSPMHFFAVFDGHGGPVVSVLLKDHMHVILADELSRAAAAYRNKQHQGEEAELCAWKGALRRSFARADELGVSGVPAGTIMGSTAVVALVVRGRILVANCGDSRAVLCRAGRAVPLSQDNKLARPDELAAAGGVMYHYDVVPRVQGILSRSRALGHTVPNPKMTCEPDITITARSDDDDCLILASNGLLKGANAPVGKEEEVQCVCAAIRLTNLAINEHSLDDISVVVLDLKVRG
ncbi:hypothetical protein VPH35_069776 [Triticum aestivum]